MEETKNPILPPVMENGQMGFQKTFRTDYPPNILKEKVVHSSKGSK
jgi:hypothetical protein